MEQQDEQQYIKGFNNGYLLAKHEPALAAQLAATPNPQNAYYEGLAGGKDQYDREVQEWSKSFSRNAPAKDEREKGQER